MMVDTPLTWDAFVRRLDRRTRGWIFRGQAQASWDLTTSLERRAPAAKPKSVSEEKLLREFERRAHRYLQPQEIPTTTGEWLALMQHYGAPTRLLDFTLSPFVAAYFALEDAVPGQDCAVWAIYLPWLNSAAGRVALASNILDTKLLKTAGEQVRFLKLSPEAIAGAAAGTVQNEKALQRAVPMVAHYEPQRLSERLSIQQGSFLMPLDVNQSFRANLDALGEPQIEKLVIRADDLNRGRGLDQLRLMNITRASLFPGLEGFAQSFRQLLIVEPDDARAARLATMGDTAGSVSPSRGDTSSDRTAD